MFKLENIMRNGQNTRFVTPTPKTVIGDYILQLATKNNVTAHFGDHEILISFVYWQRKPVHHIYQVDLSWTDDHCIFCYYPICSQTAVIFVL